MWSKSWNLWVHWKKGEESSSLWWPWMDYWCWFSQQFEFIIFQNKDQLVHKILDQLKTFEIKLHLWEAQIKNGFFSLFNIGEVANIVKYTDATAVLWEDLDNRYQDFNKNEMAFHSFSYLSMLMLMKHQVICRWNWLNYS